MMMKFACALVAAFVLGFALTPVDAVAQSGTRFAAASCTETFNRCVARCKRDVPQDTACPSDHCTPKLGICKSTGCWQEGQRYGGEKTCGLRQG